MPFVYRPRNVETILRRASQQGGNFQGFILDEFAVYVPKKGANYIRILPPTWEGAEHFGYEVWVHGQIGPENASMICLYKQDEAHHRCPICEAVAAMDQAGDDLGAKEIAARKRVMVWLLDMQEPTPQPKLWAMPWTVDRDIAKVSQDRQSGEVYVIDNPEYGYNVQFDKEGERLQTKYTGIRLDRKSTTVDPDICEYINEVPVPTTLLWRDYNEMLSIYNGGIDPEPVSVSVSVRRPVGNGQVAAPVRTGAPRRALPASPTPNGGRRPLPAQAPLEEPVVDENDPNYVESWEEPEEQQPIARRPAAMPPQRPVRAPAASPPRDDGTIRGNERAQSLREKYARK